jgi:hypothetical protein
MFRFTIRELVMLTIIAAMGAGWWIDHAQKAGEIWRLETSLNPDAYQRWVRLQKQAAESPKSGEALP